MHKIQDSYDCIHELITNIWNLKSQKNLKLRSNLNTENAPKRAFIAIDHLWWIIYQ
ncbi:hypothetical protein HYE31_00835 [Mycoplasmopsis bovis]|nr:hypothetical protein HYE31_00835 [Mycoplasmopsis bovis]